MSSPRLPGIERRSGIIKAATRLFSEKGFRGATTRELASNVGVTEPVLYQHFSNKKDLYRAILEEQAFAGDRQIPELLPPDAPESDREYLTRLANGMIDWHTSDPSFIRLLLFSALEDHEMFEVSEKFYDSYSNLLFSGLSQYFEKRMQQGVFRTIDPVVAAHAFVALVAHYSLHITIFKKACPDVPRDQAVHGFVEIFLEGMKQRAPHS